MNVFLLFRKTSQYLDSTSLKDGLSEKISWEMWESPQESKNPRHNEFEWIWIDFQSESVWGLGENVKYDSELLPLELTTI